MSEWSAILLLDYCMTNFNFFFCCKWCWEVVVFAWIIWPIQNNRKIPQLGDLCLLLQPDKHAEFVRSHAMWHPSKAWTGSFKIVPNAHVPAKCLCVSDQSRNCHTYSTAHQQCNGLLSYHPVFSPYTNEKKVWYWYQYLQILQVVVSVQKVVWSYCIDIVKGHW